jgi:hypothetical protein
VNLYVDDIREAPDGWQKAVCYKQAIRLLEMHPMEELSLDHDLGEEATGYDIAMYMVAHGIWPKNIYCHSMNPVGRHNILALLARYAPAGVTVYG